MLQAALAGQIGGGFGSDSASIVPRSIFLAPDLQLARFPGAYRETSPECRDRNVFGQLADVRPRWSLEMRIGPETTIVGNARIGNGAALPPQFGSEKIDAHFQ